MAGHKFARRNQSSHRMTPADQGFRADQTAVAELKLGLVKEFELAAFRREGQLCFQRQPSFKIATDGILKHDITADAHSICAAERHMGVAQEHIRAVAVFGVDSCADADSDTMFAIAGHKRHSKAGADLFGKATDISGDFAGKDRNREFFIAQSCDDAP